ncbi:alpha/beta fold hydrolase [Altererythrobacter sp. Z27]|uniref:alpha/beta fold hydrolase n=1 Tax=Altererythrobacter sp. Z27 TaxID=3461147 RepID=UPI004044B758
MASPLARIGTYLDTWDGNIAARRHRAGWPSATSKQIHFFQSALVQYRYRVAGTGRTLVFAADPPMTLEIYDELISTFSTHFRVVIVELPAMGFSAVRPGYGFGFRETNDDLAEFLMAVAGRDAILAFSCVSCLAALDIAERYPHLVSKLCLIQAGGVAAFARWKEGRDPKNILGTPVVGQLAMRKMATSRMPKWYDLSVGRRDRIEQFCACASKSFDHGARWSLASAYQHYLDLDGELLRPSQPILSIWGSADGSHPAGNAHSLAEIYDEVETVTLEALGHTPELEDPEGVLRHVLAFTGGD